MPSTPAPMVQPVPPAWPHRRTSGTGPDARAQTAYRVEVPRCRRLWALGAVRWRRCLVTRAAGRPPAPVPGHRHINDALAPRGRCRRGRKVRP